MLGMKESIENIRKPGERSIFIDESVSGDGNKIVLGAIIVPSEYRVGLIEHIDSIRTDMLFKLRELQYSILREEPGRKLSSGEKSERRRLLNNELPEIHATELWSGAGVYHIEKTTDQGWFSRHVEWIERTISVLPRTGIYFVPFQIKDLKENTQFVKNNETSWFDLLKSYNGIPDYIKRNNVDKVIYEPFTRLLMDMLLTFDDLAERYDWALDIICDEGKPNSILRVLKAFNIIRSHGILGRFSVPRFESSDTEPLLQLADVVTYLHYKKLTTHRGHANYELINRLYSAYVEPRVFISRPKNNNSVMTDPRQYAVQISVLFELLITYSPGVHGRHLKERRLIAENYVNGVMDELKRGVLRPIVPKRIFFKKSF